MKRILTVSLLITSLFLGYGSSSVVFAKASTIKAIAKHKTIVRPKKVLLRDRKQIPNHPLFAKKVTIPLPIPSLPASTSTPTQVNLTPSLTTPSNIDLQALNQYWITRINDLRATKNLRPVVLDTRLVTTATEWSEYMKSIGQGTHTRPNGMSMHEWIATKGLAFTDRNSPDGWKTNYFTENIAWGYVDNSLASATSSLAQTLNMMLSEKASDGPHYRTIYYPDWNAVGAGFAFKPLGNGHYQMFSTFHYGSLKAAGQ